MLLALMTLSSTIFYPQHLHVHSPAQCYFATGFMVPEKHYASLSSELIEANICKLPITFLEDGNDVRNKQDIASSSSRLSTFLPRDNTEWILFGHSRGAAVAAYTAASSGYSDKPIALILIDPVDDEYFTTIRHIQESEHFPRTYIASTPFGGSSKYYKNAVFTSSCAPPMRSSPAFFKAISSRIKEDTAKLGYHDKEDTVEGVSAERLSSLTLKEFENIGHLQLLNDRQGTDANQYQPFTYFLFLILMSASIVTVLIVIVVYKNHVELFSGNSNICASNDEEEARIPEVRREIAREIANFLNQ